MLKNIINNHIFKSTCVLLLCIGIFFGVDRLSIIITDIFLKGSFKYSWYIGHHVIQSLIVLSIILIIKQFNLSIDFGLRFDHSKQTKTYITRFIIMFIISTTIVYTLIMIIYGWQDYLGFELSAGNLAQYLLFEGVVVGLGEELLFRALIYSLLYQVFFKKIQVGKHFSLSFAVILSAFIFSMAHINFFTFTFDVFQLLMAFVLGLFYGWLLENTKSVVGPIIAHNLSDLWISILFIIFALMV